MSLNRSTASITASFARFRSAGRIQSNAPEAGTYFFAGRCGRWSGLRHRNHRIGFLIPSRNYNPGFASGVDLPASDTNNAAGLDLRLSPHGPATQVAGRPDGNYRVGPDYHVLRCRFARYGPNQTGSAPN